MALTLDPHVFRACAWPVTDFPEAGALVYYFPHGHAEQSGDPCTLPGDTKSHVLCRVVSVSFSAHPKSDEVFARFRLVPIVRTRYGLSYCTGCEEKDGTEATATATSPSSSAGGALDREILKLSDAKGPLEVTESLAKRFFPHLECGGAQSQKNVQVEDIHGKVWKFNYSFTDIKYGRRLGWGKFAKEKSLVPGDSLIFIKSDNKQIKNDNKQIKNDNKQIKNDNKLVFGLRRTTTEEVKAKAILEVVKKAQEGKEFEVDYYPRAEFAEFIVKKNDVEKAIEVEWEKVIEEKTEVQIRDEHFRVDRNFGWVSSLRSTASLPWRMLEVSEQGTDTSEIRKTNVSPWQVKVTESSQSMTSAASGRNDTNVSQGQNELVSDIIQDTSGPALKRKKL